MNVESSNKPGRWWQFQLSTLMLLGMVCALAITVAYYSRQSLRLKQELREAWEMVESERALARDHAARAEVVALEAKFNDSRLQLETERILSERYLPARIEPLPDERLIEEVRKLK